MPQDLAQKLVRKYVDGWKENNLDKIVEPLSKNCVIIESHGPTYHGIEQVKKWFNFWIKEKGRVIRWDITSFYFIVEQKVAFF